MSLYNKYRPADPSEVVGNQDVIESLINLVKKKTPPAAFLFQGPTGCGKTTLARITRTLLKCKGNDFRELDSADFRGIDTIREIRKQCQYKPLEGPTKVYLLDECHKLTGDAQNALLKILENPPQGVYFILATTDPQKLISTIKGRCSVFTVKPLEDSEMMGLLKHISKGEGEKVKKNILEQIVLDAQGHPRNAIQILEQVLSVEPEKRLEIAQQTALEQSQSIELCQALINNSNWKKVSGILKGLKDQDPESIRRHVLGYASAVLLNKDNVRAGAILEEFVEPFYNSNFPGLVFACYSVVKG